MDRQNTGGFRQRKQQFANRSGAGGSSWTSQTFLTDDETMSMLNIQSLFQKKKGKAGKIEQN